MAFFQDARSTHQPFLRAPASVLGLIGVLIATHVGRVLAPASVSDWILNNLALDPIRYRFDAPVTIVGRILPLFGYIFLHANATHIAVNCVWLLAFGPIVARRFGSVAFVLFFLLCGLAGALCYVAINWGLDVGVIGASGAISGLMGAAIRMMNVRQPYLNIATLPLLPIFSSQVLGFTGVWLVVNLITGIMGLGLNGQIASVAWEDHMGGYIAGLFLAGVFDRLVGLGSARNGA